MNKIWIQNRVLNLSGHIFIFRKLWIHQTGWIVFPLTYRTWAKSLFHFLMDTIAALPTKYALYTTMWLFFVKWSISEFDKEVASSLHFTMAAFLRFLTKFYVPTSKKISKSKATFVMPILKVTYTLPNKSIYLVPLFFTCPTYWFLKLRFVSNTFWTKIPKSSQ